MRAHGAVHAGAVGIDGEASDQFGLAEVGAPELGKAEEEPLFRGETVDGTAA